MQKCDFNFSEVTLLHGYSSVHIYRGYYIEVLSKQVKSYLKYISILFQYCEHLFNFIRDFRKVAKG